MKKLPFCLVYSQQQALLQKVKGFLHSMAEVISLSEPEVLFQALQQHDPVILIFDVLTPRSELILERILKEWPLSSMIVLGEERSAPILSAQRLGVFATENPDVSRSRLQTLVQIALRHVDLVQEAELMRAALSSGAAERSLLDQKSNKTILDQTSVREALHSFTQFSDLGTLLSRSMDWLKHYKGLGSIGVFLKGVSGGTYRLSFGLKCPKEVSALNFSEADPLVTWLRYHPSVLNQDGISEISNRPTQRDLNKALKALFAEAIFPLHGSDGLLGWIFVGPRAAGKPLAYNDLIELSSVIDYLTFVVERCMLHCQNEAQRAQFESILQALSSGIVLFDSGMKIVWANASALEVFKLSSKQIMGAMPEVVGTQLAAFIHRSSNHPFERSTMRWSPPQSDRQFLVEIYPQVKDHVFQNGFMLMQDITPEILLQENDQKIQRAEIATELAAHLSTEIRNPLVAIKTFVQLLPERYDDQRFRQSFINLVSNEVERLNHLSNGIREVVFKEGKDVRTIDLRDVLRTSINMAITRSALQDGQIQTTIDPRPASLLGDKEALMECFTHLITNLIARDRMGSPPALSIALQVKDDLRGVSCCYISIEGKAMDVKMTANGGANHAGDAQTYWADIDLNIPKRTITNHKGQLRLGSPGRLSYIMIELPLTK